jgi:hypothetical protein
MDGKNLLWHMGGDTPCFSAEKPVSPIDYTKKPLLRLRRKGFLKLNSAATYSPTGVTPQYHRRWRA